MKRLVFRGASQQAQILLGHQRTHALRYIWVARDLKRTATIDSGTQILEKGDASRTLFYVSPHLLAGTWFNSSIQVLRQICEQVAARHRPSRYRYFPCFPLLG